MSKFTRTRCSARRNALRITALAVVSSALPLGLQRAASAAPPPEVQFRYNLCRFKDDGDKMFIDDQTLTQPTRDTYAAGRPAETARYWSEISGGRLQTPGTVRGWFTMPLTHAQAIEKAAAEHWERGTWAKLCIDAAASAGDPVPAGAIPISVMNRKVNSGAYSGGVMAVPTHSQSFYDHETGHALGLDHTHSNDLAAQGSGWASPGEYDDDWDVMSCCGFASTLGGPRLNAFGLRHMGWLPSTAVSTVQSNTLTATKTITLGALDGSTTTTSVRNVQVTKPGATYSYSVELRIKRGWDGQIPASAALIHRIEGDPAKAGSRSVLLQGRGEVNDLRQRVIDEEYGVEITVGSIATANGGTVPVTVAPRAATGGTMHVDKVTSKGVSTTHAASDVWTRGWSNAEVFTVGSSNFLFLYKRESGDVHIHRMNTDGTIGDRVYDTATAGLWDKGWNVTEFYKAAGQTFLLLYKGDVTDKHSHGEVRLYKMQSTGVLGGRVTMNLPKSEYGNERWLLSDAGVDGDDDDTDQSTGDFSQVIVTEDAFGNVPVLLALQPRNGGAVWEFAINPNTGIPDLSAQPEAQAATRKVLASNDVSSEDLAIRLVVDNPEASMGRTHYFALHNSKTGGTRIYLPAFGQLVLQRTETWKSALPSSVPGFTLAGSFPVVGSGQHMIAYNRWTGSVEVWKLRTAPEMKAAITAGTSNPVRGTLVQNTTWTTGWTSTDVMTTSTQSFLFLLKSGRWTNIEA